MINFEHIIHTTFDKKPSITHKKLLDYFGQDKNGIAKANDIYLKMTEPEFLNKFHGNREPNWMHLQEIGDFGKVDRSRFTEQFEPDLKEMPNGELYFINHDGSRQFVAGKPLAFLDNKARQKLVENVVFSAVGGWDGRMIDVDFENDMSIPVTEVVNALRESLIEVGATEADLSWLKERAIKILKDRQLSLMDSDELQNVVEEEGNEFLNEEEETDIRQSNDVVRVESFLKNSKDNATANVKLMLSFIPDLARFEVVTDEAGNRSAEIEYKRDSLEESLQMDEDDTLPGFVDPHQIWRKLEDTLSNIFTQSDSGKVESVLSQMMEKLEHKSKTDVSVAYVTEMVKQMPEWKQVQFASAFSKSRVIFSTTEVAGDIGNYNYKIFDPAETGSKTTKIKNTWSESISQSMMFTSTKDKSGVVQYSKNDKGIKELEGLIAGTQSLIRKNKFSNWNEMGEVMTQMENLLNAMGIPVTNFDNNSYMALFQDIQYNNPNLQKPNQILMHIAGMITEARLTVRNQSDFGKDGTFKNPIKNTRLLNTFARYAAMTSDDISESTVMLAGNKMAWTFSMPTYLDLRLAEIRNGLYRNEEGTPRNKFVEELEASSPYYRNNSFLQRLRRLFI
ncbi:hypothetical protein A33Q_0148 [Indibacter alkaliphilus LW1]|uniref:Uncharacterized protein n=1 Tax=Indibacter alkaliphilus (strain CCUG 57479 / KCTC 22604 / LW1) TaxID=1189612 RepID=S2E6M5_INDAL|nr:hypothetical protein [Indibacter alkaliphilus]EPA00277.1 hypothetical protein A33Q_0148 [Indibacter alkaliphilus LW1]